MGDDPLPLIPFMRPLMDERDAAAAARPITSGWVTQGPEVAAFEREFALAVGAPHAVAVSNCTSALHLALLAAGVDPGSEVVTVSHSFIATANAVRYCGATPVFVDIDPATYNIDPTLLEEAITPRTSAILLVHQMGMPADLHATLAIARDRRIPVVEDAACAVGSELLVDGRWERIGRPHAEVACFSFHPRKLLSTGDGGMLTTSRPEWDRLFRLRRQHGMSVPDSVRHTAREVVFESYETLGYNYRMTDIQAAVGRVQLEKLPHIVRRRRALAERYMALLARIPGLGLPVQPAWARSNWQTLCVRLPESADQRRVMQALLDAGIATRRGVTCAHREPAYHATPWRCASGDGCDHAGGSCPRLRHSEVAQDRTILLPLFHHMTEDEQVRVVEALMRALGGL
jgi:dTDP-4-amino-4,6-dideoxygalactose transaminase